MDYNILVHSAMDYNILVHDYSRDQSKVWSQMIMCVALPYTHVPELSSPLIKSHSSSVPTFEGTENGVSATEYLNKQSYFYKHVTAKFKMT